MQEDTGHWRGNGSPTPGELHRMMLAIQEAFAELSRKFDRLDEKLDQRSLVEVKHDLEITALKHEVSTLKGERTWLWRAVATSAFAAISSLTVAVIVWLLNR